MRNLVFSQYFEIFSGMVLHYEGGLVDDPIDKGGKTNMGITQKFLDTYKKKANVNVNDVKDLTKKEAIEMQLMING